MEKEILELEAYLETVKDFTLPKFKELPGVDLYMDQVLQYINGVLEDLSPDDKKVLTSFMVNNYVKAKMIKVPVKKRYSREQIGYLIAICLMKATISMSDMSLLLEMDEGITENKERLYSFFCSMETSILEATVEKTSKRIEGYKKRYEKEKEADPEKASSNLRDSLGLLALRLAIQAQANKMLSERIIAYIRQDMHGDKTVAIEEGQSPREIRHEIRQGLHEADRLAEAKAKEKRIRNRRKNGKKGE